MKKVFLALGLGGVLAVPSAQAALTFDGTLGLYGGAYQNSSGGEFTAVTTGLGTFQTFCTEVNEHLVLNGSSYSYKQNTGAVLGGGGASSIDPNTGLPMDSISLGTALLYSQFRNGTLTGYLIGDRNAHAGELQNAIWFLENEGGNLSANMISILTAGIGAPTAGYANWMASSGGAYGVIALNLYNGQASTSLQAPDGTTYNVNQDVLAIVPEPTTMVAGALLLLPFGASALRIVRKNRNA